MFTQKHTLKGQSPAAQNSSAGKVQRKSKSRLTSQIQAHLEQGQAIQRKVQIGQPNDRYEKEADRVADKVVNNSEPAMIKSVQSKADNISTLQRSEEEAQAKVQRSEEEEAQAKVQRSEEEEAQAKVQRSEEEEAQAKVQRSEEEEAAQARFESEPDKSSDFDRTLEASKSSGNDLQGDIKAEMEAKIGADFSNIKVHTGPVADQLSKDIGALAFAVGNHVYFKEGQFKPDSKEGKHLLAHELTHTVQQGAALRENSPKSTAKGTSSKPKILEEETEEVENTQTNG